MPGFTHTPVVIADVPDLTTRAATEGKMLGYQGQGTGRAIVEVEYQGPKQFVSVSVGGNGYVVGVNPANKGDLSRLASR